MMISPGSFYDEVKDKNAEEIESEIRKLKRTISRLKREIEDPRSEPENRCPSRDTVIYWSREYLEMAKKALADAGGEYKETKEEERARAFLERLPQLKRLAMMSARAPAVSGDVRQGMPSCMALRCSTV